jgi:hypothetical protein
VASHIKHVYGYLADFGTPQLLYRAAKKVRAAGFTKWDVHSPYPIHGMDAAMGLGRSKLPWFVFFGGCTGFATAVILAFYTQVFLYPTVVQGKPVNLHTIPAFFPVMFELTILFSAFTTLFGLLGLIRLPRWNHPLFESERFARVTDDGFLISIESQDPQFSQENTRKFLEEIGGQDIELVEEEL